MNTWVEIGREAENREEEEQQEEFYEPDAIEQR